MGEVLSDLLNGCPHCGSSDFWYGEPRVDDNDAMYVYTECNCACGAEWLEQYEFTGIHILKDERRVAT